MSAREGVEKLTNRTERQKRLGITCCQLQVINAAHTSTLSVQYLETMTLDKRRLELAPYAAATAHAHAEPNGIVRDGSCMSACHAVAQLGTTDSSIYSYTGFALSEPELRVSSRSQRFSYRSAS